MNEVAVKTPRKWHEVGIQLKLSQDELSVLNDSSPTGSQLFASIFTVWKKRNTREYSWATIVDVLKTPAVDEVGLAKELIAKLTHRTLMGFT